MKKSALALTLMLVLFSVTFAVQIVKVTKAAAPFFSGISIISPNNMTYSLEPLTLKINLTALVNYDINYFMTYSLDGNNNNTIDDYKIGPPANPPSDPHVGIPYVGVITGSMPLPELSEGFHRITVYVDCRYYSGNPTPLTASYGNTVYFTVSDGHPPNISVSSPENKTYSQNDLALNFTTDESTLWIGCCLDGKTNVTVAGNTTLNGLVDGSHSILVYANDTVGNIGASETIYFSIEPFPTTSVITASVASMAIIGVVLLVYFKKHHHKQPVASEL
jgi:hypothetical protein